MIASARFAIAFALSIAALAVFPQQPRAQSSLAEVQSAMLGDWVLTFLIPGSQRGRLTITNVSQNSDGSFQIFGMWAYGDNQTAALKSGELTQSGSASQLILTTALGGLLVANSQRGGVFQGESTTAKGAKNRFKMEKAESQSVVTAAATRDSVNTPGMTEARQAIERTPVKRPYVEVGDCWSFRTTSVSKQGSTQGSRVVDYTFCVTYVDYTKDVIIGVASSGGEGRSYTFTTEWNPLTAEGTAIWTGGRYLKFPMHVGETYSFDADFRFHKSVERIHAAKWNMEVVAWEDVTVPAGAFRALRIEGIGIVDAGTPSQYQHSISYWYVPELNQVVKYISAIPSETSVQELTQYRMNR
jgi:hypothetical protein